MAATTQLEVESKFDVEADFVVPDLLGLPGVATVEQPEEQHLEATYLDTPQLRLLRSRITLRRRTGGTDAGWHLKLPAAGSARLEVHRPLGRAVKTVPAPLARLVKVRVRDQPIVPVGRLTTRRVVHRLLGADGAVLAEVADDTVVSQTLETMPGEGTTTSTWREVEVELVGGDADLLAAADVVLRAAGARPAVSVSKIGRVLGARLAPPAAASATDTAKGKGTKKKAPPPPAPSAGQAFLAHVSAQVEELQTWDPFVRVDHEDSVHKMRVATRRLRSALATYRPLIDPAVTEPLRAELTWLGGVLGAPRDAEVLHARLRAAVEALPGELVVGPVLRRIDLELGTAYREGHDAALAELDGARYLALVEALEAFLAAPPLTERAALPGRKELWRLVRRARRRVERAVAGLDQAAGAAEHDQQLHEVRKAAKRARYAGESAAPVLGEKALDLSAAMERIQEALGAHQDSVVTRALLREMGVRAHLAGENGFTFGLLHGLEQCAAAHDEEAFQAAWTDAERLT